MAARAVVVAVAVFRAFIRVVHLPAIRHLRAVPAVEAWIGDVAALACGLDGGGDGADNGEDDARKAHGGVDKRGW